MSAAAGAAGYLYASGRLRGRGGRISAEDKKLSTAQRSPAPTLDKPAGEVKPTPQVLYKKPRRTFQKEV